MQLTAFNAKCPLEIGDRVRIQANGRMETITDIACLHYIRSGRVEFCYEFDNSGSYMPIEIRTEGEEEIETDT